MTNLKEYVKAGSFSKGEGLPEGDTMIDLDKTSVERVESEFEGRKVTRYKLSNGESTYFVGPKVMEGIKKAVSKGFNKARVTRTGEGKETNYTVIGQ